MLRFTVELVPRGVESRKRTLGTIEVGNDASGTPWLGSYTFRRRSASGGYLNTGAVGEFKRRQFGPWVLLAAILDTLGMNKPEAWRDNKPRGRLT